MLNRVFCDPKVLERLRHTVLTTVPDELAEDLARRSYSNRSIQAYSSAVGHFAHWLEVEGISPSLLSEHTTSLFLEHVATCPVWGAQRRINSLHSPRAYAPSQNLGRSRAYSSEVPRFEATCGRGHGAL